MKEMVGRGHNHCSVVLHHYCHASGDCALSGSVVGYSLVTCRFKRLALVNTAAELVD